MTRLPVYSAKEIEKLQDDAAQDANECEICCEPSHGSNACPSDPRDESETAVAS